LRTGVTQFRKRSSSEARFTCSLGDRRPARRSAGFPSVHFPAEGNEGWLAFLSSMRGANPRLYPDSARGRIGQPANHLSISSESATFASGSLDWRWKSKSWIHLWRNERERERERNSVAISFRSPPLFFSLCVNRGAWRFCSRHVFPAVQPAFYTASGKKRRSIGQT